MTRLQISFHFFWLHKITTMWAEKAAFKVVKNGHLIRQRENCTAAPDKAGENVESRCMIHPAEIISCHDRAL
jgi:hypothetical protein